MIGRLAPPIRLADDGSRWYRTCMMLLDSLVRWAWYVREPAALRREQLAFEAAHHASDRIVATSLYAAGGLTYRGRAR